MADSKFTFQIDPERITVDDLIAMEDGLTNRASRDLLAKFLVNGTGEYVEFEKAQKVIGGLNLLELQEFTAKFVDAAKGLQEKLVPEARSSS